MIKLKHFITPTLALKLLAGTGVALILLLGSLAQTQSVQARQLAQQPTGSIPTVTSSPSGLLVTPKTGPGSESQINIRSGPSRNYAKVGVMTIGQLAPALGRTPGGDWIMIAYPGSPDGLGWVYTSVVDIVGIGELPIAEPPSTPTPQTTPTIDPTLAAQFLVEIAPTGLPTFTEPAPLSIPTFTVQESGAPVGGVPMGFLIVGMGVVGLFAVMISILRGR